MASEVHLSALFVYPIPDFHEADAIIDQLSRNTSSNGHIPGVEVHMASLDSFYAKGPQSSEVLSQTDTSHNLSKLLSVWISKQHQGIKVGRIGLDGTALRSH